MELIAARALDVSTWDHRSMAMPMVADHHQEVCAVSYPGGESYDASRRLTA